MSYKTVTWPVGTRLAGIVRAKMPGVKIPTAYIVDCAVNGQLQAFVLLGGPHSVEPNQGDEVFITFLPGGPMGGYWSITGFVETAANPAATAPVLEVCHEPS